MFVLVLAASNRETGMLFSNLPQLHVTGVNITFFMVVTWLRLEAN